MTSLRIALAAGMATAALAAPAHAITFGSDLSQPANNPVTCGFGLLNQTLGIGFPPFGQTCAWSDVEVGTVTNSLTAPLSGHVRQVRVKVGATTGPMQIVVVRFLFQQTANPA